MSEKMWSDRIKMLMDGSLLGEALYIAKLLLRRDAASTGGSRVLGQIELAVHL